MAIYLVATPIGNLEDITLRALRVLKEVRLIAAEDTRTTRQLLTHYGIKTPLTAFYEHSGLARLEQVLRAASEGDVAVVSEAGMPGLSDPGYELVAAAIERGICIIPVPGATAPVASLVVSGLSTEKFLYLGFLPRRNTERRRLLDSVALEPYTLVAFEAPHRLLASLQSLLEVLGDRRIAVARELTKLYEEIYRGTLSDSIRHFSQPRGEFTLVIEGYHETPDTKDESEVRKALHQAMASGLSHRDASRRVAKEVGWSRKEVYRLAAPENKPPL